MKKVFLLILICLTSQLILFAQIPPIEKEQWDGKPVMHQISSKYANEPAVVLLDKRRVEFIDDPKNEVLEYYTQHRIIHINDDHGIEYFNKVYIHFNESSDVVDVHARTILPNGKIIEFDNNTMKDIRQEDGNQYKIFALEGLEKGCEVEYYYTSIIETSYFGREIFQTRIPVMASILELVYPSRLVFETKLYNCQSRVDTDSTKAGKTIFRCNTREIPGADEEKYSSYESNLSRMEYKLSYNNATHAGERLFTWNDLAKKIFADYSFCTDKENKSVLEMIKSNGWAKLSEDESKIMAAENYIKKNFMFKQDYKSGQGNDIEQMIKTKIAGTKGIIRLYGAVFRNLDINFQFVLAADRNNYVIDKTFENWDNCDYPLLYFPKQNKYMAPTRADFRYPLIFPSWGAANALFCKGILIGNHSTAIAEVHPIPLEDYQKSYDNVESNIELAENQDSLNIDLKLIFGGYAAAYYREGFNYATADQINGIMKELVKNMTGSEKIISSDLQNVEFESENLSKPFIIHAKVKSADMVERAGNKILVKIGQAIGQQVEMYQEKPRMTPVSIEYPHFEARKIQLTIPDGYTIKNLNDLKMEQVYEENGERTMGFSSNFEQKGNTITVTIMEDYRKTYYPVSQFEEFKKIINASSDFNKVVLVLEKAK
ncbi:MAG: hypothetical protein C5B59_20225 [Bacteroidetes bacterium]|nr:MAG: hypothetical protein C5B59_20225 [Bacteroidota bacterium]